MAKLAVFWEGQKQASSSIYWGNCTATSYTSTKSTLSLTHMSAFKIYCSDTQQPCSKGRRSEGVVITAKSRLFPWLPLPQPCLCSPAPPHLIGSHAGCLPQDTENGCRSLELLSQQRSVLLSVSLSHHKGSHFIIRVPPTLNQPREVLVHQNQKWQGEKPSKTTTRHFWAKGAAFTSTGFAQSAKSSLQCALDDLLLL